MDVCGAVLCVWGDTCEFFPVEHARWLVEVTRDRDWKDVLPRGAQYLRFDYAAEDELVRELVP